MAPPSEPDLLVLHGLRLKSSASVATVAELVELPFGEVEARLHRLADAGLVRHRDGALPGWSLTPAGRARLDQMLADELAHEDVRAAIESAYRAFLEHNQQFLALCTDWQLRAADPPVVNDHLDPVYDQQAIDRLRAIDAEARLICADLASALARFGHYGRRFGDALRRVEDGHLEWFTKPVIDSYHTVWFELHEDLLATLGLRRSDEAAS